MSRDTTRRDSLKWMSTIGAGTMMGGLAGCTGKGNGGNGDSEDPVLRIPGMYDMSGPTSDVGRPTAFGTIDFINYVNDNDLLDVMIEHEWVDYAYDINEAVRVYEDFVEDETPPAILGWGTPDSLALAEMVAEDKVVYVNAGYTQNILSPETPYNFYGNLDYPTQGRLVLEYIDQNDPGSKISFAHHGGTGGEVPAQEAERYAETAELDVEFGPLFELPLDTTSTKSLLRRAKDNGVNYIFAHTTATPVRVLAKDAMDVYPDVQITGTTWTFDEFQIEQAPEPLNGVQCVQAISYFDEALETDDGGDAIGEAFKAYRDTDLDDRNVANIHYVRGFIHGLVLYRGIENTLEMDLDPASGADLLEGMLAIDDWDCWGLSKPFSYDEGDRRPTMSGDIYEVVDGEPTVDQEVSVDKELAPLPHQRGG